jgi:integrase
LPQQLNTFMGKILRITPDMIRQFIAARRKARASDPTIRRNLVLLRAMLNQARKEGKIRFADVPHFPMPKDSAPAGQYLAPDVFARLLPTLPENLQPFFQFLYGTGCRLGAAQQITWDMVSPDGAVIKLPGEIVKSRTPLTIVLDGPMLQPIAAMLRKSFRTDGPVFDTTNFRMEWNKACAKLKLGTFDPVTRKRTGLRIHDLRCSAAVNMIDAGLSEDVVMKIGGWKTHSMLSRYNVLDAKRLRAAMTQAGNHVAARM